MSIILLTSKKKQAEQNLLLDKEKQLEDNAIDCDIEFRGRLAKIYQNWAKNLKEQHKEGLFKRPLCFVSSHIKARMRIRGASDGAIMHVSRSLTDEFKLEKYDTSIDNGMDDNSISLAIEQANARHVTSDIATRSIFLDFDQMAKECVCAIDLFTLLQESTAECSGVVKKKVDQLLDLKKRIKMQLTTLKDWDETYHLSVFPPKRGVDLPPEHFRGKSQFWFKLNEIADHLQILVNHVRDTANLVHVYKPSRKTDLESVKFLEKAIQEQFNPFTNLMVHFIDGIDHLINAHSNGKVCASHPHWLKMGYDDIVNTGTRGSGVVNAIMTGQQVVKIGKDEKSIVSIDIKRPFTKEDLGEQVSGKLLKKAFDTAVKDPISLAFQTWTDHTEHKVNLMQVEDYYRKKMNIPDDVEIKIVNKKVPYVMNEPIKEIKK